MKGLFLESVRKKKPAYGPTHIPRAGCTTGLPLIPLPKKRAGFTGSTGQS